MPLVQKGMGYALEPSLDEDLWGTPLYFKEHEKPLIKEKNNQSYRVLLLLKLNLHVEGILVVIQLKSTVRDLITASGIDDYFNFVWAFAAAENFTA